MYLLKPNLGELSYLAGKDEVAPNEIIDAGKDLINNGRCEVIIVSMGAAGARLITKNETHQVIPPPVKRKSTVGAGDSMVAGIVLSLFQRKDLLTASHQNKNVLICFFTVK